MTKKQLIYALRRKTGLDEVVVRRIVDLTFEIIVNELKGQKIVKIHRFGTFRPSKYRDRKSMKLQAGKLVKEYLNF